MRFFEPSVKFVDWLAKYSRGRIVVDCGSGEGHVVRALHERKVRAIGVDPLAYYYLLENPTILSYTIQSNAQDYNFLKQRDNLLVLFCRPCHNNFVAETLEILLPKTESLYISKPENVHVDIPLTYKVKALKTPKCPEEKVYRVTLGA